MSLPQLVDLVKIQITSTGNGTLTLGSAIPGYRGVEALTNGQDYSYSIQQDGNYEIGDGTYLSSGNQFVRSPIASSNGGAAIILTANANLVFTALAKDFAIPGARGQNFSEWATQNYGSPAAAILAVANAAVSSEQNTANTAAVSATLAGNSASAAVIASASLGVYPISAASNVPQGVVATALTAGTGGTNGTNIAATFSGGNMIGNPSILFDIVAGTVANVRIITPGLYIGASPSLPTVTLPGGAGGAALTLTLGYLVSSGNGYWVQSASGLLLNRYKNVAGTATADSTIGPIPTNKATQGLSGALNNLVPWGARSPAAAPSVGATDPGFGYGQVLPCTETGTLVSMDVSVIGNDTYTIYLCTASGNNLTFVSSFSVALSNGFNPGVDLSAWAPSVTKGTHYFIIRSSGSGVIGTRTNAGVATMQYSNATFTGTVAFTSSVGYELLVTFYVAKAYSQTIGTRVGATDVIASDMVHVLTDYYTPVVTGSDPSAANTNGSTGFTYISGRAAAQSGRLAALEIKVSGTGDMLVFVATGAAPTFTIIAAKAANCVDGVNTIDMSAFGIDIVAGVHSFGYASMSTASPMATGPGVAGMTQYFKSGIPNGATTFGSVAGYDTAISPVIYVPNMTAINSQLAALSAATSATPPGMLAGADQIFPLRGGGWNAMLVYGQSLGEGYSSALLSTTQPYLNVTFGSGPRSGKPGNVAGAVNTSPGTTTSKPLVEDSVSPSAAGYSGCGETVCSAATTELNTRAAIESGVTPANLVQFASVAAHGGYAIAALSKGSTWYNQLTDHIAQGIARAKAAGADYQLGTVPQLHGEADADANTTRLSYYNSTRQLRSDIEADYRALSAAAAGGSIIAKTNPVHMLIQQVSTWGAGGAGVTLASIEQIALAQLDAATLDPRIHIYAPGYPFPRVNADKVHETGLAEMTSGRYLGRARKQLLIDKKIPDVLQFVSAVAKGTALTVHLSVPALPLVFDTTTLAAATNYGIVVKDDTGAVTLSAITLVGNTVTMTLGRALGANPKFRYALDQQSSVSAGPWGNLRESSPDTFTFGGTTYPMYHWALHTELNIAVLESL